MGKQASSALGQRAKASVLGGTRREFLKEITLNTHWKDVPDGSAEKNPPAAQEAQELRVGPLGREEPLEDGVAAHSSAPACRTPWTQEPGGLPSTGRTEWGTTWVT